MEIRFIEKLKEEIVPILRAHEVVQSSLFGSMARGEATEKSDVDILIRFRGDKTLFDLIELKEMLEKKLSRHVDVVTYDALNRHLRERVFRQAVPLFDDKQ